LRRKSVVRVEQDEVYGQNDAAGVLEHVGGMSVECGELIEVALETERTGVTDGEPVEQREPARGHELNDVLRRSSFTQHRRLGGENDQFPALPRYALKADVITEKLIGEAQPHQVFAGQCRCQSWIRGAGNDGKSVTSGVGGFLEKWTEVHYSVFLTATLVKTQTRDRVGDPAASFTRPGFQVPLFAASAKASLARR